MLPLDDGAGAGADDVVSWRAGRGAGVTGTGLGRGDGVVRLGWGADSRRGAATTGGGCTPERAGASAATGVEGAGAITPSDSATARGASGAAAGALLSVVGAVAAGSTRAAGEV
jgi:hypothetical protein